MKKKLLSLVLAGAMVASTSVSAFAADTNEQEYNITSGPKQHKVTIDGNIANTSDEVVPGTISVTVPTAVSFTIDKEGQITGGEIKVKNSSNEKVKVVAKEFIDTNSTDGIVIVKENDLDSQIANNTDTKRHISLKLVGDKSVGLISNRGEDKTGFLNDAGEEIEKDTDTSLGEAWNGSPLTLRLVGRTTKRTGEKYSAPGKAIQNDFNLILKIQKSK